MREFRLHPAIATILAVVLAVAGAFTYEIFDDNQDGRPDRVVVKPKAADQPVPASVGVDGPDADAKPDTALPLDPEAREIVRNATQTPEQFDISGGLRDPNDKGPVAQHTGPLASPTFPGCTTRILPTNWSARVVSMSLVDAIEVHYTAGGNRTGLSDMNGLTGFASSPTAKVSWHFLIDAEGHCYYSVPLQKSAWTIAGLNSRTVNIEVIGTGKERTYPAGSAGAKKLRAVVRQLGRDFKIPMRLARTDNCKVQVSGIGTHWMGGPCSGGHIDIKPYDIRKVVAAIAAGSSTSTLSRNDPNRYDLKVLTDGEEKAARCLLYERRVAARGGGWAKVDKSHNTRAVGCKRTLGERNDELHKLKITTSAGKRAGRPARHRVIHEVV